MIQDADDRGVRIDLDFRQLAKATNERILAERNLRYELGNLQVETSNVDQVENLTNLITTAKLKGVADNYLEDASNLKN
jgi:flagellar basal body rod protein FlgG